MTQLGNGFLGLVKLELGGGQLVCEVGNLSNQVFDDLVCHGH